MWSHLVTINGHPPCEKADFEPKAVFTLQPLEFKFLNLTLAVHFVVMLRIKYVSDLESHLKVTTNLC